MYIVDASVLVKWFVDEPETPQALRLKTAHVEGAYELVTLDFAILEVANALHRSRGFTAVEVERCCGELYALELDLIALVPDLVSASVQVASRWELTVYDATYVALAQELGMRLVTADRKLHRAITSLHQSLLLAEFVHPR